MNRKIIEAKITAYNIELERSVTNRRRTVIANELHKLSALLNEGDKSEINNLKQKHSLEISELKSDYEDQISKLIDQLNGHKKESESLKEEKRINKLKAQNIFKKLNAKLTPDEMKLFSDGLDFIRVFIK